MSLRINHNIASLNGHRQMIKNDSNVSKSLEKLSSGLRINRAADDAAGLIISEQMRAQIGGLGQAVRNSETAVSMVQTAEGALDEVNTLLLKARDLALHASNEGANDQNQLVADQAELDNIIDSVNRIATNTQFGNKKILDGSMSSAKSNNADVGSVQLGGYYTENVANGVVKKGYHSLLVTTNATKAVSSLTISGVDIIATGAAATNQNLSGMALTEEFQKAFTISVNGADVSVASGTTKGQFLQQLNAIGAQAGFQAVLVGAESGVSNGTATGFVTVTNGNIALIATSYGSDPKLGIQFKSGATGAQTVAGTLTAGADVAGTIYFNTGTDGGTATSGNTSMALSGKGLTLNGYAANSGQGFSIQLTNHVEMSGFMTGAIDGTTSGATFQIGANIGQTATVALSSARAADLGVGASATYGSLDALKGGSLISGKASDVLKIVDKAIDQITVTRGKLGAFQANTLESGISSMMTASENLTAAESSIRDVDFAAESANFTKNNILMQAATAMLAQANQLPNNVLQLLG